MSLDEKFIPIRTAFYEIVENLFEKLAGIFGYPEAEWITDIRNINI